MKARLPCALAIAVLLSGCASDWQRSVARWDQLAADTPNGKFWQWTTCIDRNSRRHEEPLSAEARAKAEAEWDKIKNNPEKWDNDASGFAGVLADCRDLMKGPAWRGLSGKQVQQMLGDAWQHYLNVQAELGAADVQAII
ncbi:hypothetical protein [Novosphingobium sp. B 225]|uniref:hypothetical protein n=1 Tax=Novosphingobium sp. B 225 TaxID=1961849 RepID=UPI000B4B4A22|nr:hypothetical protein [Novosphingobium sp. B 225]